MLTATGCHIIVLRTTGLGQRQHDAAFHSLRAPDNRLAPTEC